MKIRRPLALSAAATIGFASLFVASPALADDSVDNETQVIESGELQQETEAPVANEDDSDGAPEERMAPLAVENAVVTSVTEGQEFPLDEAPMSFSGTGDAGDEFLLIVSGEGAGYNPVPVTVAEDGTWEADATYEPSEGLYSVNLGTEVEGGGTSYFHTVNYRIGEGVLPIVVSTPYEGSEYHTFEAPTYAWGTGEPGADIEATLTSDGDFEATVTAFVDSTSGSWTSGSWVSEGEQLPAGAYALSVTQTVEGTTSDPVVVNFTVLETDWTLVTIDGYGDGGVYSGTVGGFTGAGEPGATLRVYAELWDPESGDTIIEQELTATVGEDGTWSVTLDPAISGSGYVYVSVSQYSDAEMENYLDGDSANFDLVAPVTIASPAHGSNIAVSSAPAGASGTAPVMLDWDDTVLETEIVVTLATAGGDTEEFTSAVAADGTWSVDFGRALAVGDYTLSASLVFLEAELQEMNNISAAVSEFSVTEGDPIADTGSGSKVALGAAAGGIALLGGAAMLLGRRNKAAEL